MPLNFNLFKYFVSNSIPSLFSHSTSPKFHISCLDFAFDHLCKCLDSHFISFYFPYISIQVNYQDVEMVLLNTDTSTYINLYESIRQIQLHQSININNIIR
jgi:hypothetical protein